MLFSLALMETEPVALNRFSALGEVASDQYWRILLGSLVYWSISGYLNVCAFTTVCYIDFPLYLHLPE